jgi:hypothetical protein
MDKRQVSTPWPTAEGSAMSRCARQTSGVGKDLQATLQSWMVFKGLHAVFDLYTQVAPALADELSCQWGQRL